MLQLLKQSQTASPLLFWLGLSGTSSAATGLTPTVTLSKAGSAFAAAAGAVSEVGNGWYAVAANATDTNTLGTLKLHATATGADSADVSYQVVGFDPTSAWNSTVPATTSAVAAAVWRDQTSSADFTSVGSIGKFVANPATPAAAPTTSAIAAAVWRDQTSSADFTSVGSIGKFVANPASPAAAPTTSAIAAAVWRDQTSSADFATVGTIGNQVASITLPAIAAAATLEGTGPVAISSDTGGSGNLAYQTSQGTPIGGANVLIYNVSDWPHNPGNVQAQTTTQLDGSWGPLYVSHGTFVAVFTKIGVGGPDASASFTV